jgi:hypothetical protein
MDRAVESDMKEILTKWFNDQIDDTERDRQITALLRLNSREELCKNIFYSKFYNLLNELSIIINLLIGKGKGIKKVSLILSHMWRMRTNMEFDNIKLLNKLFRDRIYDSLSTEDKEFYDRGYDIIAHWKDYFLSYTRRNLPIK